MAKQQQAERESQNGHDKDVEQYEKELANYLRERIKPGLNKGAIPLLARSIARDIAKRDRPGGATEDAEPDAEADVDEEPAAEEDDAEPRAEEEEDDEEPRAEEEEDDEEPGAEEEEEVEESRAEEEDDDEEPGSEGEASYDFEAEMHELQEELGEDWILRFSVQGDDAWLTAEKDDGSQRVEAPTAEVLTEAVDLLNDGG